MTHKKLTPRQRGRQINRRIRNWKVQDIRQQQEVDEMVDVIMKAGSKHGN